MPDISTAYRITSYNVCYTKLLRFIGKRYDAGDKLGYLKAIVDFGLSHQNLGTPFREFLRKVCAEL